MRVFVDISAEFRGRVSRGSGKAKISLSCLSNGKLIHQDPEKGPRPVAVEDGTRNRLLLLAAVEGLRYILKPGQDIVIRTKDPFYLTQCLSHLEEWREQNFCTKSGPRANEKELRLLWMQARVHRISVEDAAGEAV